MENRQLLINDFATRCFRHNADYDYIAARLCYSSSLIQQFHWQALQAIEKYLKAILLYNRIKAKNVGHSLSKALEKTKYLPFDLKISESTTELLIHIDQFGSDRYLGQSYFINGFKLVALDRAVWEIRRYCTVLNYEIELENGQNKNMLSINIMKIEQNEHPYNFIHASGELEKIIKDKQHSSRKALIYHNLYFSSRKVKQVKAQKKSMAVNSPLSLHPEILEEIKSLVYLPLSIKNLYSSNE